MGNAEKIAIVTGANSGVGYETTIAWPRPVTEW